jgi:hypothetical protein
MIEVKCDCVGKITAGEGAGTFVKVLADANSKGAFSILQCENEDFLPHETFDSWVPSETALRGFFEEAGWSVLWLTTPHS